MAYFSIFLLFIFGAINFVRVEKAGGGLTEDVVVNSINTFGSDLLHGLYENGLVRDNIFVSPINVYATLTLLLLGSSGKTRDDLTSTLKTPKNVKSLTEILRQLNAVSSKIAPKANEDCARSCATTKHPSLSVSEVENKCREQCTFYEMRMVNGLFLHKNFPIKKTYLESVKEFYDSLVKNVDFTKSQESTSVINEWISNSTKGRIPKFYENPISSETLAILTSALYFNARWKKEFMKWHTKNEIFDTGLEEVQVPTMYRLGIMDYVRDDTLHYESVSIPYTTQEYEMTVYLHKDRNNFLTDLLRLVLESNNSSTHPTLRSSQLVELKMPKLKFSWKSSLVEALRLRSTFDAANLEAMTTLQNLRVSDMMHATELEVNEMGTTATAVSGIQVTTRSGLNYDQSKAIKFHVNRPFLVTIGHVRTRVLLFAGIIRKPI